MIVDYFQQKLNVWVVSQVAKQLKTFKFLKINCMYSLVPSLPSKTKNLAKAAENWAKSAIKLSIKILLYSIS